jgi:hypothetical protein
LLALTLTLTLPLALSPSLPLHHFLILAASGRGWSCGQPDGATLAKYLNSAHVAELQAEWNISTTSVRALSFEVLNASSSYTGIGFCLWSGVTCLRGDIVSIALRDFFVSGPLPRAVGYLSKLTNLDVGTGLTGSIPSSIGKLTTLSYLQLDSNGLTGPIPTEISALTLLRVMDLQSNSLSGTLPNIFDMSSLEYVYLRKNMLTGTLPPAGVVRPLPEDLVQLNLQNNELSGDLNEDHCFLTNISIVALQDNDDLGCYVDCFVGAISDNVLVDEEIIECNPTSVPTSAPSGVILLGSGDDGDDFIDNPTNLAAVVVAGSLLTVFILCVYAVRESRRNRKRNAVYIESMVEEERKEKLDHLPIHKCLRAGAPVEECIQVIQAYSDTILDEDYDGNTAFDYCLNTQVRMQLFKILIT